MQQKVVDAFLNMLVREIGKPGISPEYKAALVDVLTALSTLIRKFW